MFLLRMCLSKILTITLMFTFISQIICMNEEHFAATYEYIEDYDQSNIVMEELFNEKFKFSTTI